MKNLNSGHKRSVAGFVFAAMIGAVTATAPVSAQGTSDSAIHDVPARAATSRMVWQRDLRRAMKQAKSSDKMVLIDIYTDWCGPCKMLDANTYSSPDVVMYLNKSFVCVKVNAEDPTLGNWVSVKYEIDAYPSIVVLAANGKEKGKFVGYCGPQRFLSEINRIATK